MSNGNLGPLFHCLQVKKQSYLNPNPLFIKRGVLQNLLNVFVSVFAEGGENGGEVRQTDRETDGQIDGWISVFPAFLSSLCLSAPVRCHTQRLKERLQLQRSSYSRGIIDKQDKHSSTLMIMVLFGVGKTL